MFARCDQLATLKTVAEVRAGMLDAVCPTGLVYALTPPPILISLQSETMGIHACFEGDGVEVV